MTRVLALARFRLAGALRARRLLAPLAALVTVEAVLFVGAGAPAAVAVVTALALGFPVLAWTARQVLDAEPDGQQELSGLAVGGPARAEAGALLPALAVVLVLALLCAGWGALHVDGAGVSGAVLVQGAALALGTGLAAVAVGAVASRGCAGEGGLPVVVLVAAPVLTAVLGLARSPYVTALVPRLGGALRAADRGRLGASAPALVAQLVVWSAVVLALAGVRRTRR